MASAVPSSSGWSASMLVTIPPARRGEGTIRHSSASTTKASPVPRWAFEPESCSSLPIAKDGSTPHACRMTVSIEVVVVFAVGPGHGEHIFAEGGHRQRIGAVHDGDSARSGSDDFDIGRCDRRGDDHRPDVADIALIVTDVTFGAERAQCVHPPESFASEPLTRMPRAISRRAKALILAPPTPTMHGVGKGGDLWVRAHLSPFAAAAITMSASRPAASRTRVRRHSRTSCPVCRDQ